MTRSSSPPLLPLRLVQSLGTENRAPPRDRLAVNRASCGSHGGAVSPLRRGLAGFQRVQAVHGVGRPARPAELERGGRLGPRRFLRPGQQFLRGDLQLQVDGGPRPRLRREADRVLPKLQHHHGEHSPHQTHHGGQLPERRRVSGNCFFKRGGGSFIVLTFNPAS